MQNEPVVQLARLIVGIAGKFLPRGSLRRRLALQSLAWTRLFLQHGMSGAFRIIWSAKAKSKANKVTTSELVNVFDSQAMAEPIDFAAWITRHEPSLALLMHQRELSPPYQRDAPLFSVILPVYKIPSQVLAVAIKSVQQQTWQNWELCIVYADHENEANWEMIEKLADCDPRLHARRLESNGGISRNSNAALDFALGEFIALLDHDDELAPWALHDMATTLSQHADIDMLFSDKDFINEMGTLRRNPFFKPKWSPEMMYSVNYLTHFNVMRRTIVKEIGGWIPETDGAQDWDLFLRVAERSRRIEHVPSIHYHWRAISGSTASIGVNAKPYVSLGQLRTLERRVKRLGLTATVGPDVGRGFQIIWDRNKKKSVDLILHSGVGCNPMHLINTALNQLDLELATITVLLDPKEHYCLPTILPGGIKLDVMIAKSSDTINIARAVAVGKAPVVMLVDRAVVRFSSNALQDLTGWVLNHPEIGFVSGLILTNDDTIVEAGRIVGDGYRSQPLFQGMPLHYSGPFGRALWYRNVCAVAPRAIAFKRDCFSLQLHQSHQLDKAVVASCADVLKGDLRGLVSPHAHIFVHKIRKKTNLNWHESMRDDPYFHPAFCSITPLQIDSSCI